MKYTTEEALSEILRRGEGIACRRNRRVCRALSGVSAALCAALVLVIALLPAGAAPGPEGSVYGAFLLSPEAGGYVLAAVLAFALGVCVTLLCLRRRRNPNERNQNNEKEEKLR